MKKILFSLAFIASLSAFADVKWQETVYDFGAFSEEMGAVSCDFVFVNNGPDAVAVTAARASCGCTTPKYTRDVVAPGDTGHITVTYDPAGRPGRFEKVWQWIFPINRARNCG